MHENKIDLAYSNRPRFITFIHFFCKFSFRYRIVFQTSNVLGRKSEYAVDNFSMSPQCFGLGVESKDVGDWRYNMTDLQFCKYYGKNIKKVTN